MLAKQLIWTQEEQHKTFSWLEKRKNQKSWNQCQQFLLSPAFTDTLLDSTSCSQNSPSARVRKWEQTLMLSPDTGQMGKEWPEAAVLLLAGHKGSPGMMEIAKNSGVRAWPQGYHSLCPQPQTELGTRTGMKHPKQAEKDWLVRKRLAEEMGRVMVLCISVVCTGRLEGNICWLPLGEDNQENQTGYYNTGPQLKSKLATSEIWGFFPWQRNWILRASFLTDFLCQLRNVMGQKSLKCLETILVCAHLESYTCLEDTCPLPATVCSPLGKLHLCIWEGPCTKGADPMWKPPCPQNM